MGKPLKLDEFTADIWKTPTYNPESSSRSLLEKNTMTLNCICSSPFTTFKIRPVPLVLTTNNECCIVQDSAEDVSALTAVSCTVLVKVPYYANFFASKPSGCVAHLHPALAAPSGTDTCVMLNRYNLTKPCVVSL